MDRSELTPEQLQKRSAFVQDLVAAGWDPRGWEDLFESGASLTPEAQAEYQNDTVDLRTGYFLVEGYVSLELTDRSNSSALSLRFYPKASLTDVVTAIIGVQDSLSPDNYMDFVKDMLPLCDPLLVETPEGLVEVSEGSNH